MPELIHLNDLELSATTAYQLWAGWAPVIRLAGHLAPVWQGPSTDYKGAYRAAQNKLASFRAYRHVCNGCGVRGADMVDPGSLIGGELDQALVYHDDACWKEAARG